MPKIGRIQSTNFQALLTQLGIVRNDIPFDLRSEVTPVVLVGGTVSFVAAPTPPYTVVDFFSLGVTAAPPVNTVLADTGPLPVGVYGVQMNLFCDEGNTFEFQWRNAGNSANLMAQRFRLPVATGGFIEWNARLDVQNANERFRAINTVVGTAAVDYQIGIFAKI